MEFRAALRARHMVRTFTDQPIERAVLVDLLEDARRAPSAGNTQATEFVVLGNAESVSRYWSITMPADKQATFRWQSLLRAPALVLVLTRPDAYLDRYAQDDKAATGRSESSDRWPVPYWWVDAGCVVQNLLLSATDRGLGACFFGPFDFEGALRSAFAIPEDRRIVATVALGHPAPDADQPHNRGRSATRTRQSVADIIHWDDW